MNSFDVWYNVSAKTKRGVLLLTPAGQITYQVIWAERPLCMDLRPVVRLGDDRQIHKGRFIMKVTDKIKFYCTDCGEPYYTELRLIPKRKTTLCRSCMLRKRNQSPKMRELASLANQRPKRQETKDKLRRAQKRYWTEKRRQRRSGKGNPYWKGGRHLSSKGYVYVRCIEHPRASKTGYIFEHILVMEKHLGRYLDGDEVVHHVNGNKTDNRIKNLVLMSRFEHTRYHNNIRWNKADE